MELVDEEENKKIIIVLNPIEKILSFKFKNPVFYYKTKKEEKLDYFKHYIRFPGTCFPRIIKIGTFYRIKNKNFFILSLILLVVSLLFYLFLFKKNFYFLILGILLFLIVFRLSLGDKAFYYIKGKEGKSLVYYLNDKKENKGFKYVIVKK